MVVRRERDKEIRGWGIKKWKIITYNAEEVGESKAKRKVKETVER